MENSTFLGPLCALGASFTWALGSAEYSRLSRGHSAFAVNFSRALVALPCFLVAAIWKSGGFLSVLQQIQTVGLNPVFWLGVSIFASYGLGDVLFLWSTRSLGVPSALAIASTYPILNAGVGVFVQGESLAPGQLLGLFLTVAGVIAVILSRGEPTSPSSDGARAAPTDVANTSKGVVLALLTMVFWSLNAYATSRAGRVFDPFTANAIRMTFALIMSAALSRAFAPRSEIGLPVRVIRKSLGIIVFEAFGGSFLFMYGLSHSPMAVGSALTSLAPVISVPVALALGLERFSLKRTAGVLGVVAGLVLLLAASNRI